MIHMYVVTLYHTEVNRIKLRFSYSELAASNFCDSNY